MLWYTSVKLVRRNGKHELTRKFLSVLCDQDMARSLALRILINLIP